MKDVVLPNIVEFVLKKAKEKGATQAEVAVTQDQGFQVSVRQGEVETVEYQADREAAITVYFGHRKAQASTTDIRESSIITTLDAACAMANYTQDDPYSGLADGALMATQLPDLDMYHPWKLTASEAIDLALDCERQAFALDKRISNSDGASVSNFEGHCVYGNSHGFIGESRSTLQEISLSLIAQQQGQMERDYSYTAVRSAADLASIQWLAKDAAHKTVSRLGARQLPTMKVPVLFCAEIARELIGHFLQAISGHALYRQSSFLVDSLGKAIFPKHMHLHEMPYLLRAMGSSAFDSEGAATRSQDFILDGVLQRYLLGSYAARRLGLETTANADGAHNLIVDHHGLSFEALLKKMQKGLLVTEVMGQGVNLVTGDYSRGATGFWVEDGKIQYPVAQITIAGNLKDMFGNMVAVADDVDRRGNVQTGSILLEEMMVAGE